MKGSYNILELNKIYNEDCIGDKGMCLIPDKSIDMILCDLPYGTTVCSWDSIIPFDKLWEQYNRIIKPHGAIVLTATQPFASKLVNSNINNFKHEWIWNKTVGGNFINAKYCPIRIHESILVFANGKVNYNPIMKDADLNNNRPISTSKHKKGIYNEIKSGEYQESKTRNRTKRYPTSILEYSSRAKELNPLHRIHPTQKPVDLFEYLIKTYTNEDEIVLDNCMGSGTTAVACINTNRKYIGFETDKNYFDMANKRIESI
jgi:DNA modification methylase